MGFDDIFVQQKKYNRKIRLAEPQSNEKWTETYLLGIMSEVNEILDEIRWKRHRKSHGKSPDMINLAYEFADVTKYVLSMWELWGFSSEEVLEFVKTKSDILDELFRQEFEAIPSDQLIVITDIDGTLGDWRKTFINWTHSVHGIEPVNDIAESLRLDSDLAMRYSDYYILKEEFESSGQYRYILTYPEAADFLRWLKANFNAYIIAHTARPWQRYHRIWGDTWEWIQTYKFPIDQLRIGSESRILLAGMIGGDNVLMLEDDPGLMLRAACSGIQVVARKHPYNNGVSHDRIISVENFEEAKESIRNEFTTYCKTATTSSATT